MAKKAELYVMKNLLRYVRIACINQYHRFLIKCTKNNKMKKVAFQIDIMHFFGQLQAWDYRNIKKEEKHTNEKVENYSKY